MINRQRWYLPEFMCAFCPFVQTLSVNVSVFTLTIIAVRRYRAVAKPLKVSRWQARCTLIVIWTGGMVLALPMLITLKVKILP
jgi:leucokinin receptor